MTSIMLRVVCIVVTLINFLLLTHNFPLKPEQEYENLKLNARDLDHCQLQGFPQKPDCEIPSASNSSSQVIGVHIWKINTSDSSHKGVLVWAEEIKTACWEGFFGDSDRRILSSRVLPPPPLINQSQLEYISAQPLDTPIVIDQDNKDIYAWSWLHEVSQTNRITYGMKVSVLYSPTGDIRQPGGSWIPVSQSEYYTTHKRLYLVNLESVDPCPFILFRSKSGITTEKSPGHYSISIPSSGLQFFVHLTPDAQVCRKESHLIYQSSGGYLISFANENGRGLELSTTEPVSLSALESSRSKVLNSDNRAKRNSPSSNHSQDLRSELRESLDYSSYQYEMNQLLAQENRDLKILQHSACLSRSLAWMMLTPPDLPTKIAQYEFGSVSSWGEYSGGRYNICHTVASRTPYHLVNPIQIESGMVKVQSDSGVAWIEPVTGIIFPNPRSTVNSVRATWIPLYAGGSVDLATGQVLKAEVSEKILPITLAEAHTLPRIYGLSDYAQSQLDHQHLLPNSVSSEKHYWFWRTFSTMPGLIKVFFYSLVFIVVVPVGISILRIVISCLMTVRP